jgi:hypothetical protein
MGVGLLFGPGLGSGSVSKRRALGGNHRQEFVPRGDKRLCAVVLQLRGERLDVHARLPEGLKHSLAVAPVGAQQRTEFAMLSKRLQGVLGHRVDGEGSGEPLHIQRVGSFRILRAGAREQQPLRSGARVEGAPQSR